MTASLTASQRHCTQRRAEIIADIKATERQISRSSTEMHALCCKTNARIEDSRELISRVDTMLGRKL